MKVFTLEKMISVREKDILIVDTLLSTPRLESFQSFLYRLRGRGEAIKPTESVDIVTLPCKQFWLVLFVWHYKSKHLATVATVHGKILEWEKIGEFGK